MTTTNILSLLPTQEGIWLADQVAEDKSVYVISHCIELVGDINPVLLVRAIQQGLSEADTVTATYQAAGASAEQVLQTSNPDSIAVGVHAWRGQADGKARAWEAMWADTCAELPADQSQPLYRQALYQVTDETQGLSGNSVWLWYQRYHHIMLDGYSFTALTRRIAAIYNQLLEGETPDASPFVSVAAVVAEQQVYRTSAKWEKSKIFWRD